MKVRHTIALACACALAATFSASALRADDSPDPPVTTTTTETTTELPDGADPGLDLDLIGRLIARHRQEVWRWQRMMGRPLTRSLRNPPPDPEQRAEVWRHLAVAMHRRGGKLPPQRARRLTPR